MYIFYKKLNNKGATALLTVMIISVSVFIISFGVAMLGLGELDMGYTSQKGTQSFYLADGCIEEALHRLRNDNNYNQGSLSLGSGTCIISVSGTGNIRNIYTTSTVNNYSKSIKVGISFFQNSVHIDSWEEI